MVHLLHRRPSRSLRTKLKKMKVKDNKILTKMKMPKLSHGLFLFLQNIRQKELISSSYRYLNRGKRHTVCEQGTSVGNKARRSGARESNKERGPSSRRASDTSSNLINNTARAHLERLYNNAVNSKTSDEDLTTSSLQELQKLQKQVQKVIVQKKDQHIGTLT